LDAANRDIIDRFSRCVLPRCWGDEKRVATDGTQYDLAEENLMAERHIRYGVYGGIAYHHVSDLYILLFSHFIACGVWEAIYIIDGLLKNRSAIQPTTVHADTQGQNLPVFALSHLLGIQLMPRIRNWKDLKFYRPNKETTYTHLEMSAILKELVQEGYVLTKDELAALSPYQTQHIKRFGNSVIDLETLPQPIDDDE
jgi:TnpA family transposase